MSARPIRRLPDALINLIAAGEVIERPANVVKELVENALDAGARRIEIDVLAGGRERIVVRDDGRGIPEAELPLALERHCTSKLDGFDALADLDSLGFRGEALASIAAVSELTLTTRTADARNGFQARLVDGQAQVTPAAHPPGTTVAVSALFDRVPARRAFLKGPGIELAHIQTMVRQIAFATPDASFLLRHGGRQILSVPAGEDAPAARLSALFGSRFADEALAVRLDGEVQVTGWIAPPEAARNQRDLQVLAVNGRPVRDRHLHHAARTAFGDAVPAGQYPAYALSVQLPRRGVDVNVHPAKLEVRFAQLRDVHDAVYAGVHAALPRRQGERSAAGGSPQEIRPPRPAGRGRAAPDTLVDGEFAVRVFADGIAIQHVPQVIAREVSRALARETAPPSRPLLVPVRVDRDAPVRLADFGFAFEVETGQSEQARMTAIPRVVPPVDAERFAALVADGEATPAAIGAAAAAAWSGELTAVLEHWLATGDAGGITLDGSAIRGLLSRS